VRLRVTAGTVYNKIKFVWYCSGSLNANTVHMYPGVSCCLNKVVFNIILTHIVGLPFVPCK
jgi:hypothetical protein